METSEHPRDGWTAGLAQVKKFKKPLVQVLPGEDRKAVHLLRGPKTTIKQLDPIERRFPM